MPTPGDPSFDRGERATRAKEAASGASDERLAELRAKYLAPASAPKRGANRRPAAAAPAPRAQPAVRQPSPLDVAAVARTARAALDKHPATWTSYAELCSAMGLTRSLAPTIARQVVFDPTGSHWFRVRDEHGAYAIPAEDDPSDAEHAAGRPTADEADQQLETFGVAVVDGRADPARKLAWTGSGWALHGEG